MNETTIRKGTIMRRTTALALLGLACLMAMPSIAEARYRDGMNLYEYVQSRPTIGLDPEGTRVIYGKTYQKSMFVQTTVSERSAEKTLQAVGARGEFEQFRQWKSTAIPISRRRWLSMSTLKMADWEARVPFKCKLKNGRPAIQRVSKGDPVKSFLMATQFSRVSTFSLALPNLFGITVGGTGDWGVVVDPFSNLETTSEVDGTQVWEGRITAWWVRKKGWFVRPSWAGIAVSSAGIGIAPEGGGAEILAEAQSKKYTVKCRCNTETGKAEIEITLSQ